MLLKICYRQIPTDSCDSGSWADASQRLFRINTLGLESFWETVWKNCFSARVIVDSAFRTKTNTSAFKQWLSIQSSKLADTSTPGESTKTTSSRSRLHRSRGQNIRTKELSLSFSWHKALASCFMFCKTLVININIYQKLQWTTTYHHVQFLIWALRHEIRLASITAFHLTKTVCCVSYAAWQNLFS